MSERGFEATLRLGVDLQEHAPVSKKQQLHETGGLVCVERALPVCHRVQLAARAAHEHVARGGSPVSWLSEHLKAVFVPRGPHQRRMLVHSMPQGLDQSTVVRIREILAADPKPPDQGIGRT